MVKLDELFHNMVQSPNLFSIAQHDEITSIKKTVKRVTLSLLGLEPTYPT